MDKMYELIKKLAANEANLEGVFFKCKYIHIN